MTELDENFIREYCKRTGKPLPLALEEPKKKSKHNNIRTNGYMSRKEANRAAELKMLWKSGEIAAFAEQVRFKVTKEKEYRADFVILNWDGTFTIEDVKGQRLELYKLKYELMKDKGLEIKEV